MFAQILSQLAGEVPGTIGVLFLDYEGETVSMLDERPFDLSDDDLKIIGAYQGIFLTRLRDLCDRTDAGRPARFKIDFGATRVFSCDLLDGYYLVLIVDRAAGEAVVWRELLRGRDRLLAEM